MDLLFELATWHALAKLRLHTESTVRALESSTTRLGMALRRFQSTTCAEFVTRELPSDEAARGRHTAAKAKKSQPLPKSAKAKGKEKENSTGKKKKKDSSLRSFNFSCYKPHALGDYAKTIRLLGPSDGYSTQTVCVPLRFSSRLLITCNIGGAGASSMQTVLSSRPQGSPR